MADPDALRFTSELMLRTKGSCDFWTCSVDSAESLVIRVLTTTAPVQCVVSFVQGWNQLCSRPGYRPRDLEPTAHRDYAILAFFSCALPTSVHAEPRRRTTTVHTATRNVCYQHRARAENPPPPRALFLASRDVSRKWRTATVHAATRPGPGAEHHPLGPMI